jgi:hypothetical protein
MPVTAQKTVNGIVFTVSGTICQRISDWESALDKQVFNEQLKTGLFRGRPLDDDTLVMMRMVKEQGHIAPYYGVGGSRGSCAYTLKLMDTGNYGVRVENTFVGKSMEFHEDADEPNAPTPRMLFKIDGQEYRNLCQWDCWIDKKALTSRYVYCFGRVSLGRLGYTVKVGDTVTQNEVDVTEYADW